MIETLNPQQQEAVKYCSGPLLVLAGAGSGKTRVIAHKIVHLIRQDICSPEHIVALSFTNKAAQQMSDTLKVHQEPKTQKILTSTFHALGLQIIRQEHRALNLKPNFSLLDSHDVVRCLRDLFHCHDPSTLKDIQRYLSLWKNQCLTPEEVLEQYEQTPQKKYAAYYGPYIEQLNRYHALDFDDLILKPTQLFEQYPDILTRWQQLIRYLLIDEYQDTSHMQYRLLEQLTYPRGALTAVGDDHQAIYAWRGANTDNLLLLKARYPHLKVIPLEQNYRSTNLILSMANRLMTNSQEEGVSKKSLWSSRGDGSHPVLLNHTSNEEAQAQQVAATLVNHQRDTHSHYGQYAILYRSNHQSRLLESQLRALHIPYRLSGGQSFFDKMEIKDITAYLRLISNTDDDAAFLRAIQTPPHGISATTLDTLSTYAAHRQIPLFDACGELGFQSQVTHKAYQPLATFCDFICQFHERARRESADTILQDCLYSIHYETYLYDYYDPKAAEERADHVHHFVQWIQKRCEASPVPYLLKELLQKLMLIQMLNKQDETDAVHLSTIHAAKGLEYPYVFVVGCEEGTLPHKENLHAQGIEEERRLMYVAVTRAQDKLWLSYCSRGHQECAPSRFLKEMGLEEKPIEAASEDARQRLNRIASLLNALEKEDIPI